MHKIDMWIDGACFPNPGKGAYAVLLRFGEHEKFFAGALEGESTNQRAEIAAVIEGFNAIKEGWLCDVTIYTNSKYLVKTMSGEWDIKSNSDLFNQLELAVGLHRVTWQWIKSQSTPENLRCHEAAELEAREAFSAVSEASEEEGE